MLRDSPSAIFSPYMRIGATSDATNFLMIFGLNGHVDAASICLFVRAEHDDRPVEPSGIARSAFVEPALQLAAGRAPVLMNDDQFALLRCHQGIVNASERDEEQGQRYNDHDRIDHERLHLGRAESGPRSGESPLCCACLRPTGTCSATKTGFHNQAMKRGDDQDVGPAQTVVAVDDGRDSQLATERWRQVRTAED